MPYMCLWLMLMRYTEHHQVIWSQVNPRHTTGSEAYISEGNTSCILDIIYPVLHHWI
ncbi:hypothetical protein SLEP1_g39316 [Rubroshorea leprosula]|uniref:Uncharacterized protein n=1 Tax=Rubroshorea leprosula TaxID=152421 RepID=A0AAV5KZT6_9ROSI|nr:hypothetical protein SLEP1_g39316 [Rubroshorea leprosula]